VIVRRIGILLASMVLGCVASPPATFGAAVIGSDLANAPTANGTCSAAACTWLETLTTPNAIKSPITGVIVSWSSLGGSGTVGTYGDMRLRVLSEAGGGQYSFFLSGPVTTIPPASSGHPLVTTAVVPGLPIQQNDLVAIDLLSSVSSLATRTTSSGAGFGYSYWIPPAPDLATSTPNGSFLIREYQYQAKIETDADHDNFGDESQDKCVGTPGQYSGCPNTFGLGKAKAKGTKVKLAVNIPGSGRLKAGSASDAGLAAAAKSSPALKRVTKTITSTNQQQVTLTLKLSKSGRAQLASAGKLKLKIKVLYTPPGGPSATKTTKAKLSS